MNLPPGFFSSDWLWLTTALYAYFLFRAIRSAPWRALLDNGAMVHAWVGLMLGMAVFWQLKAGVRPGINFHVLGSTLFMLMFGRQIAILSLTLVMTGIWLYTGKDLLTLGINGLLMIALPVLFTEWLLHFSKRNLPKNLFLFVLFNGFICAGIGIILNALVTTLLLLLNHHSWAYIRHYYLPAVPILMLVEALFTGMLITAFTVFQPNAVMHFSDEEYLKGK